MRSTIVLLCCKQAFRLRKLWKCGTDENIWKRQRSTLNHWNAFSFLLWQDFTHLWLILTQRHLATELVLPFCWSCISQFLTEGTPTYIPRDLLSQFNSLAIWHLLFFFSTFSSFGQIFWWRLAKVSCLIFSKQDKAELPSTLEKEFFTNLVNKIVKKYWRKSVLLFRPWQCTYVCCAT